MEINLSVQYVLLLRTFDIPFQRMMLSWDFRVDVWNKVQEVLFLALGLDACRLPPPGGGLLLLLLVITWHGSRTRVCTATKNVRHTVPENDAVLGLY